VNKASFIFGFVIFFVLFIFIKEGHPQFIDPLIDSPGNSIGSDFNGDGIHDFIVGARGNADGGAAAGAVYVFFGASNLSGTFDMGGGVQSADVTIIAKAGDRMGQTVSVAGDVNGDGFDDIIVGARENDDGAYNAGAAYIFFGSTSLSGTKSLGGGQSADVTILGKATFDSLGLNASGAGDVNGDGFDDFIVGAYKNNDGGTDDEGAVYIFFGASDLGGTKALGGAQSADVTILGKAVNDFLGESVSSAGDVKNKSRLRIHFVDPPVKPGDDNSCLSLTFEQTLRRV